MKVNGEIAIEKFRRWVKFFVSRPIGASRQSAVRFY
jgi:hypothetical protein